MKSLTETVVTSRNNVLHLHRFKNYKTSVASSVLLSNKCNTNHFFYIRPPALCNGCSQKKQNVNVCTNTCLLVSHRG